MIQLTRRTSKNVLVSPMIMPLALNWIWFGVGLWNALTISLMLALNAMKIAINSSRRHPARRPLGPKNQILNPVLRSGAVGISEISAGTPSVSGMFTISFSHARKFTVVATRARSHIYEAEAEKFSVWSEI
jgi:hypothetical protein